MKLKVRWYRGFLLLVIGSLDSLGFLEFHFGCQQPRKLRNAELCDNEMREEDGSVNMKGIV
jgi:hypothetical protein